MLAPRLAVWGLVGASASFNWTHAPHHPGAPEAFGLMPVIGAILFEFTLRELQTRSADRADRQLTALRWLHPAERVRVQLRLAADDRISADAATRRVRVDQAARRLYQLRLALHAQDRGARPTSMATRRARIAERRAHGALTRAGFADPAVAADVLRQVQVLTRTPDLARLDYTTAAAAQEAIASLITAGPPAPPPIPDDGGPVRSLPPQDAVNGHPAANEPGFTAPGRAPEAAAPSALCNPGPERLRQEGGGRDASLGPHLVAAAARILAEARQQGDRLSQKALGEKLRRDGHRVANHSLHRLAAAASGLLADGQAGSGGSALRPPSAPAAPHPDEDGHATAYPSWPALAEVVQVAAEPPGDR
jgi:hypothetical protein